jgi:DnaJ-class molecular chaperone
VLKHHPDKKAAGTGAPATDRAATLLGISVSQNTNDDAFFKCIQKAHEVLTNPEKRRQFDSVDPAFLEEEEEKTGITATEFKVRFHFPYIHRTPTGGPVHVVGLYAPPPPEGKVSYLKFSGCLFRR